MKKALFFILNILFLMFGMFFIFKTANAQSLFLNLNKPPQYAEHIEVQTVCKPSGYLPISGSIVISACENNNDQPVDIPVYKTPLDPLNETDGNGRPTGIPDESKTTILGYITTPPVSYTGPTEFSGLVNIPQSNEPGFYRIKAVYSAAFCVKGGGCYPPWTASSESIIKLSDCDCPRGYVSQDGICIESTTSKTLFSIADCPPGSVIKNGICINGNLFSRIFSTNNCPAGSVVRDGICIKSTVTQLNLCGNGTKETGEQCDTGTFPGGINMGGCTGGTRCISGCICQAPLAASCSVSPTSAAIGDSVLWTAVATGGNGTYTYSWSGTEGLSGTSSTVSKTYLTPGEKTGSVTVVSNGVPITVNCSNSVVVGSPPQVEQMSRIQNYCESGAGAGSVSFSWTYNDPDDSDETKFEFEVSEESDFDPLQVRFVSTATRPNGTVNSQQVTVVANPALQQIAFNTTYYWRVKVYDNQGNNSGWVLGPSFATADHAWPHPDFTISPTFILVNKPVSFTDSSTCFSASCTYLWDFKNNNTSTDQNPSPQIYASTGKYSPELRVCNELGCCSKSKDILVRPSLGAPQWKEISPF